MAINWVEGVIIPIVSTIFIGGIILFVVFFVTKGFRNSWKKSTKFVLKYNIFKKPYPEETLMWCSNCIDKGIGYYDAKKLMLIKGIPESKIDETLFIFDKLINQLNKENKKQKGGVRHGGEFKRSYCEIKSPTTTFPEI